MVDTQVFRRHHPLHGDVAELGLGKEAACTENDVPHLFLSSIRAERIGIGEREENATATNIPSLSYAAKARRFAIIASFGMACSKWIDASDNILIKPLRNPWPNPLRRAGESKSRAVALPNHCGAFELCSGRNRTATGSVSFRSRSGK